MMTGFVCIYVSSVVTHIHSLTSQKSEWRVTGGINSILLCLYLFSQNLLELSVFDSPTSLLDSFKFKQ